MGTCGQIPQFGHFARQINGAKKGARRLVLMRKKEASVGGQGRVHRAVSWREFCFGLRISNVDLHSWC